MFSSLWDRSHYLSKLLNQRWRKKDVLQVFIWFKCEQLAENICSLQLTPCKSVANDGIFSNWNKQILCEEKSSIIGCQKKISHVIGISYIMVQVSSTYLKFFWNSTTMPKTPERHHLPVTSKLCYILSLLNFELRYYCSRLCSSNFAHSRIQVILFQS